MTLIVKCYQCTYCVDIALQNTCRFCWCYWQQKKVIETFM